MDEATCKICFCYFAENVLPRMLDCGHSYCSECISIVIKSCPQCPDCRTNITKVDVRQYPTNYGLLHLAQSFCAWQISKEDFKIKTLIPLMDRILVARNELLEKVDSLLEEKIVVNSDLLKLENLIQRNFEGLNTEETMKTVNEIKKKFKIEIAIPNDANSLSCREFIHLGSFHDTKDYLFEIYKRIQNCHQVFACHRANDRLMFGQISYMGSKLFFHAMSKRTDFEETNKTVGVQFQEVKEALQLTKTKMNIFLKIFLNHNGLEEYVYIKPIDHPLMLQFIKLCTGECGPSYKGSKYNLTNSKEAYFPKSFLEVTEYMLEDNPLKGSLDYIVGDRKNANCSNGQFLVSGFDDGGFRIINLSNQNGNFGRGNAMSVIDVVGEVINPSDLKICNDLSENAPGIKKIIDCGFFISLN